MPKAKAIASLSGMIDSDMENVNEEESDVDMMPTPESYQENAEPEPVKKLRGRPKAAASKVTKPKASTRRTSAGSIAPKKRAVAKKRATNKRAPLKEQANEEQAGETPEVDEFAREAQDESEAASCDELDVPLQSKKAPTKRGKTAVKAKKPADDEVLKQVIAIENDGEFEYTPTTTRQTKLATEATVVSKKPVGGKHQASGEPGQSEKVIPETQPLPMELDQSTAPEDDEGVEDPVPQPVYKQAGNARASSRQRQPPVVRRRAGSASDMEKGASEPATRRKLGEMTKKFENLELKYRNLREIGIKEADSNFEKLKRQSEERTKASNDLITSLKKELATQKAFAQEARSLQKDIADKEAVLSKAHAKATQLAASLSEAHNENKAMQAKLAASRAASASVESVHAKTPGSAMKGKGQGRTIMVGSAEAAQAAQIAQLKEDLYSDLTGLILRGVDRGDEIDLYDCIQTGRNGTLHFKLAVANDSDGKTSYEDTEFQYTPRLDSNRDRDLLELLPDYLSEEITFSRLNAAKFYSRVVETLTRKKIDD